MIQLSLFFLFLKSHSHRTAPLFKRMTQTFLNFFPICFYYPRKILTFQSLFWDHNHRIWTRNQIYISLYLSLQWFYNQSHLKISPIKHFLTFDRIYILPVYGYLFSFGTRIRLRFRYQDSFSIIGKWHMFCFSSYLRNLHKYGTTYQCTKQNQSVHRCILVWVENNFKK